MLDICSSEALVSSIAAACSEAPWAICWLEFATCLAPVAIS